MKESQKLIGEDIVDGKRERLNMMNEVKLEDDEFQVDDEK
jgi:hypothetical protein